MFEKQSGRRWFVLKFRILESWADTSAKGWSWIRKPKHQWFNKRWIFGLKSVMYWFSQVNKSRHKKAL